MTAPDVPGRLEALRARGGKLVVVDPRRSKTAEEADEHLFIRPGTDAHFLFAIVHTLFAEGLVDLGDLAGHVDGLDEVERLAVGVLARDGRAALRHRRRHHPARRPRARGRTAGRRCTAASGRARRSSARSRRWLVDVVNVLTGNLDRPGGAMFTKPAAGSATTGGRGRRRPRRDASAAATAGCAGSPSSSASSRWSASPRRSRRRARGRSARSSRSPATRCSPTRTRGGSTGRWRRSTSW